MKVVGLITEYNPFHNGHLHHLNMAKKITGADYVVVIMSGDFVQRGAPALLDKFSRTRMALSCGADLVLELPVSYAVSSAESFAFGAVSSLHHLGVVDTICFGSEEGSLPLLTLLAELLSKEPLPYQENLKEHLKAGLSFPAARANALLSILPKNNTSYEDIQKILEQPNNILSIEYLKAIRRLNSPIIPVTIPRISSSYHQVDLGSSISSATAIREALFENSDLSAIEGQMPEVAYHLLKEQFHTTFPICLDDFSLALNYKLLSDPTPLTAYGDLTPTLENRIKNHLKDFQNTTQFIALLKSKNLTYSGISRCLMQLLLNIKKEDKEYQDGQDGPLYHRVLGFRRSATPLLSKIKENSALPFLTRIGQANQILSPKSFELFQKDLFASNLYQAIVTNKFHQKPMHEYTRPLIIV